MNSTIVPWWNMETNKYQNRTYDTAIYQSSIMEIIERLTVHDMRSLLNVNYVAQGLAGEAGEVSSLVKKLMRDKGGDIRNTDFQREMCKELGDCMWYISQMCNELNIDLGVIMEYNLEKLQGRKDRGTLGGSGDDR